MKHNVILYLLLLCLYSCKPKNNSSLLKTSSGFEYIIIKTSTTTDTILQGDVVKVQLKQYVDDSLLNNTYVTMPVYIKNDSTLKKFDFTEIIPQLKVNDSAICYFGTKAIIEKGPKETKVPSFLKNGKQIIVHFKVISKFASDSLAKMDYDKEKQIWDTIVSRNDKLGLAMAAKRYDSLISKQPQGLIKLANGVKVQLVEKGTGAAIKTNDEINVHYRGFTDLGNFFESTLPNKPFELHIGHNESIVGFEAGLASLHLGDSAHIFVPAPLAYGTKAAGNKIPAFSNLIFKVRVTKK
jgi:FKBP-type peptidyl-prolyl cis-trans isomerase FkpA